MSEHVKRSASRPWRRTARSVFQATITLAAIAPGIYQAATQHQPAEATGWAASGLVIAGAVTRVMALPSVDGFLRRYVPFLGSEPAARS